MTARVASPSEDLSLERQGLVPTRTLLELG
jgi:hypothetical protein